MKIIVHASQAVLQVTTMLSHVEEVGKATLPDQAELDTLRSNVAKQQQKVELSTPHPSANGVEVMSLSRMFKCTWVGRQQLIISACMQRLDSFSAALLGQAHQACSVRPGQMIELEPSLYGCVVGIQAATAGDAGKAKGADKAVRKEAGRLTKLQEELERLEARCSHSFHPP